MKKSIYILLILTGMFSCTSYKDAYHAEHEDNHDLKQSKRIIEGNKSHKEKNDKIARENQVKIQAEMNEKNKTTSKTKAQKSTDTSFRFY